MEERVKLEMREKQPSELMELVLDNCKSSQITGLTSEFTNLTTLSLINVGLTSLDGLPTLPSIRTIDLSDNKLSGDLGKLTENCPRLYHINLCANKIITFDALLPLQKLEELTALDLFDCSITELPDYRQKVFEMLPQLKYLDGFDINDAEADISDEDEADFHEDLSDEEDGIVDEEENGLGLSYLNSSKALDDDDSEDFVENAGKNGGHKDIAENNDDDGNQGKKRKHEGDAEEEPQQKV